MVNYLTKIIVFVVILIIIFSCDATKRVPKDSYLLQKNTIIVNDKKINSPEVYSYLRQKPNEKILGIPFSLYIYNLGNPDFQVRFKSKPKKEKFLTDVFSEKQVTALGNWYKNFNDWFLKSGNQPVISDSLQIKKSLNSLYRYYLSKGYFDTEASYETHTEDQKMTVDYLIKTYDPYYIDSISTQIASPALDSIYRFNTDKHLINKGEQIDYQNFENEENRIVELFRNSGVYHFGKNIMEFWIDSLTASHKKNVLLKIPDRTVEENDSIYTTPFKVQYINKVNVFTDFSFENKNQVQADSAYYKGYTFYATGKLQYNPKYLSNAIVIEPGGVYKDQERDLTRKYLRELQNFRPSVDIKYTESSGDSLTANIYLTPLKKYSFNFDAELNTSNIKPLGISGKFSLLHRNIFKGAEVLELSFLGSFINALDVADNSKFFNARETGTSLTLKVPRIFFPFNTSRLIPKRMTPKTNISLSLSFQKNIGLDRKNITGGIDYAWNSSPKVSHKFELINMQFIKNQNPDKYFDVFNSEYVKLNEVYKILKNPDSTLLNQNDAIINFINEVINDTNYQTTNPQEYITVEQVKERREILIENFLVPIMSYTYTYNNRQSFTDNTFSTFTGRLISSGNIVAAFVKKPTDGSNKELFGQPIARYLKTEFEFKNYRELNYKSTLVSRIFTGIAIPFHNSTIPFSRSYRAGGSNDIRAWRTFRLGPGAEDSNLEFNTGTLKLTANLEYRFNVINSFNGALFVDAGNIWDITNSNLVPREGKFLGLSSLKNIAVGSGFGVRYDFSFLVLRVDVGFKTYEPYLPGPEKWFKNYNFGNAVYNIGINYPF